MKDLFKSDRPGHGVAAVQRYLTNVVTGRPDLCAWIGADDNGSEARFLDLVKGLEQLIANVAAERIDGRFANCRDPDVHSTQRPPKGVLVLLSLLLSPCQNS